MDTLDVRSNGHGPPSTAPQPDAQRFVPLRAGIIGLWQYDDQEYCFHRGRLLLRGENGMGKSKALELLLPFLFDADLRPERLDPFRDRSRTMRWNLLGDAQASGLGYSWLEFGRRTDEGPSYVTIGAGLRATQATSGVDVWYFVGQGRRGIDFDLLDAQRVPHTRDRLREALRGLGTVYETKAAYRQAVDATLFDLGPERYAALIELLLELRHPQLSKRLDPSELSRLLSLSLSPLDPGIMERLADALEALERIDEEIRGLHTSRDVLAAFVGQYRQYAIVEARRRGASVRRTTSQLHSITRQENQAREDVARAEQEIQSVEEARAANDLALSRAQATRRGLETSEAFRSAQDLERLRNEKTRARAEQEEERAAAERASHERERWRSEVERSTRDCDEAADQLRVRRGEARRQADASGLSALHDAHESALISDPVHAQPGALGMVKERRRALEDALKRGAEALGAMHAVEQRRRDRDEAEDQRDVSRAAVAEAEAKIEQARLEFGARARAWLERLSVLRIGVGELDALIEEATTHGRYGHAMTALAESTDRIARDLTTSQARVESEIVAGQTAVAALCDRRERIASKKDEGPPPRRAERVLAGAPLWLLCDFTPRLEEWARAGVEAALEDAGLLDAWVTPDGRALDPDTFDVVLVPSPLSGPTLRDALEPVEHADVATHVTESILRSLALGGDAPRRIGLDGSWSLGPVQGRHRKPLAEHIGAGARERLRRARLDEIDRTLAGLRADAERLTRDLETITRRFDALHAERRAFPEATDVEAARAGLTVALAALDTAETRVAAAAERLERAEVQAKSADATFSRICRREDLPADMTLLQSLAAAVELYRDALADLAVAAERQLHAQSRADAAADELQRAEHTATTAAERLASAARHHAATASELDVLQATAGASAREVIDRLESVDRELHEISVRRTELEQRLLEATATQARAQERLATAAQERADRERDREEASAAFHLLLERRLAPLALPDIDAGAPWTVTRALDLARDVHQRHGDTVSQETFDRALTNIHHSLTQLQTELSGDFSAGGDMHNGLFLVTIVRDAREYEAVELVRSLEDEIARRRGAFEDQERQVIEDFILKELGLHLQERIAGADELVAAINTQLREHPTASGLTVQLRWRALEGDIGGVSNVRMLLRKDLALMDYSDVDALVAFLRGRIDHARADIGAGRYADHLATALDYRTWHVFELVQSKDGRTETLTRRRHAQGSGGERAVALHLPLFAAAAAHYRSAAEYAPRLVMLDEAFAGIDHRMRGACMALLQVFDLDFVMTSHDEWGFYAELDGIATYQLSRDPEIPGVAAVRFVWDGHTSRRAEPALLDQAQLLGP